MSLLSFQTQQDPFRCLIVVRNPIIFHFAHVTPLCFFLFLKSTKKSHLWEIIRFICSHLPLSWSSYVCGFSSKTEERKETHPLSKAAKMNNVVYCARPWRRFQLSRPPLLSDESKWQKSFSFGSFTLKVHSKKRFLSLFLFFLATRLIYRIRFRSKTIKIPTYLLCSLHRG